MTDNIEYAAGENPTTVAELASIFSGDGWQKQHRNNRRHDMTKHHGITPHLFMIENRGVYIGDFTTGYIENLPVVMIQYASGLWRWAYAKEGEAIDCPRTGFRRIV